MQNQHRAARIAINAMHSHALHRRIKVIAYDAIRPKPKLLDFPRYSEYL